MTKESKTELHPLYDVIVPEVLTEAEGGKPGLVVALDNANSGLSVGRFQMDLSQRHDLADELADLARKGGWAEPADIGLIDRRTRDLLPEERRRAEALVRRSIQRGDGAGALARAEHLKLLQLRAAVLRLRGEATRFAAAFLGGLRGQIELACHLHQFGTGSTAKLTTFLSGVAVRFGEAGLPAREVKAKAPLDLDGFRAFRAATKWGHLNERARLSRDERVDRAYAEAVARVTGGGADAAGLDGAPDPVRRVFARDAAARGTASAIKRLQRLVNAVLRDDETAADEHRRLAVDGAWGPLSRAALGVALRLTGADGMALAKRLALDAADEALRQAERGNDPLALQRAYEAFAALGPDATAAIRLAAGEPREPSGIEVTCAALANLVAAVGPRGVAPALYGQTCWRALGGQRDRA